MAQHAIDELVVTLTLESDQYLQQQRRVEGQVAQTEKKLETTDRKKKKREVEQNKRYKETTAQVKQLGNSLKSLALTVGSLLGVGSVAGIVGSVVALGNFETSMRRASVSTGLSNREMQAWGGAARRLGADANAGASALADLAKEQKQFNLTGEAPTLQAFQRVGVRATPDTPIQEIIGQAQQVYRQSSPAQKSQMESSLSAQGVSADLIVMIKSETDAREAYNRSLEESTTENKKGLQAISDAMSVAENALLSLANTIATVAEPYIKEFANWAHNASTYLSAFNDRVSDAGGGLQGFTKVLREESPELAKTIDNVGKALSFMGEAIDLTTYGLKLIGAGFKAVYDWIDTKLGFLLNGGEKPSEKDAHPLKDAVGTVVDAVKWAWKSSVADARFDERAKLSPEAAKRIARDPSLDEGEEVVDAGPARTGRAAGTAPFAPKGLHGAISPQEFALKAQQSLGLTPAQALAVTANAERESSLDPTAVNKAGGGQGARGLFQWRGPRLAAFQQMFGKSPNEASVDEQLDFIKRDPEEQRSLKLSLKRGGNSALSLGQSFSRNFERHGNVSEDVKRGQRAAELEAQNAASGTGGQGNGVTINGPVTVQADNPRELVNGLQRASNTQNYASGVR